MGTYSINSTPLSDFNIIPGKQQGSNLAIAGAWDMPARIGKLFNDWKDEKGIEPYVSADEIRFGGRDISIVGSVTGTDKADALQNVYAIHDYFDSLTGLATLSNSEFGSWNVYVNGKVESKYIGGSWYSIRIPFREPVVPVPDAPEGDPETYYLETGGGEDILDFLGRNILVSDPEWDHMKLDEYKLRQMGMMVISAPGKSDRPEPKPSKTIAYGQEGFAITKTAERQTNVRFFIEQTSYSEFQRITSDLFGMMASPGLHTLALPNDEPRSFFAPYGFRITEINRVGGQKVYGFINMIIVEA